MRVFFLALLLALVTGSVPTDAQTTQSEGSIVVKGLLVKAKDRTRKPLARKRFYLFPGGLADNQPLIDRIKAAELASRDCFYVALKASPCFLAWLREENCESPFCRVIKREDIGSVPEFEAAYNKGLPLYARKSDVALGWLLNNMPDDLVSGYYRHHKSVLDKVLAGTRPIQSTMTTSTAAEATFVGLPASETGTTYLVSNLLPVEVDDKSYVWACEVEVQRNKIAVIPLQPDSRRKNCIFISYAVRSCTTETCEKK